MKRLALIVGAMRSGTTSLFHYLAAHPQVAASADKEPDYFSSDKVFARGPGWYEELFSFDPARHTIRLEASTNYSKAGFFPSAGVFSPNETLYNITQYNTI